MYSLIDTYPKVGGFPHSDIVGSKLVYQLPYAFRRLLRPSSPLIAKASTMCAYSLDHITRNKLGYTFFCVISFFTCIIAVSHDNTIMRLVYFTSRFVKEQCIKHFKINAFAYFEVSIHLDRDWLFVSKRLVELRGIEPRTSCVQGRRSPS
jgi:hypothetical protein